MVREELIIDIDNATGKPISQETPALSGFYYKNGYELVLSDLGKLGVKIELTNAQESSAAVILPPNKTEECSKWMGKTLGLRNQNLPGELSKIFRRLLKEKRPEKILERGDKKIIKDEFC